MEIVRFVVHLGVQSFLPLMMLALGLGLDYREIGRWIRRPLITRGLFVGLIGVPCLAMLVVTLLPERPIVAVIILLMAMAPGCPMLVLPVRRQKGSMAGALTLTLVLTFAAVVTLPIALTVVERLFDVEFRASIRDVLIRVGVPLVLPTALGLLIHARAPRLARQLAAIVVMMFKAAVAVVIVLLLVRVVSHAPRIGVWDVIAMLMVTIGSALIGHFAAGAPEDRSLLATAAVYGNPAIVLSVMHASYPTVDIAPMTVLYILLRAVAQIPFRKWERRHLGRPLGATP